VIHFQRIIIQEKGKGEDYRAFLDWGDSTIMMCYQIRGYGSTPGQAANDAYAKYEEDRERYTEDEWKWEEHE
jgi:hypothetical protein